MKVCIRTDASATIGSGHVMRCIALAEKLRSQNAEVRFVCREFPGDYTEKLRKNGFVVERLASSTGVRLESQLKYAHWLGVDWETDAEQTLSVLAADSPVDWLVIDHYAIDKRWEKRLRAKARYMLVIDDLADRPHDCDILLDQNRISEKEKSYRGLVPSNCKILLGPFYALLRSEFAEKRTHRPARRDGKITVLVFWGGVDRSNQTRKTLEALKEIDIGEVSVSVVVGKNNPHRSLVEEMCRGMERTSFHFDVDNMVDLIFEADIAAGAPGVSSWERCCLGLPAVMASVAENQVSVGETLNARGAGVYLGPADRVTPNMLRESIFDLIRDEKRRQAMSRSAMSLVDGLGAGRVVEAMLARQ